MDTMTHSTALATHAVDRYALGDMGDDEATAFETHYFECADCAREVRETMSFVDNARVALRGEATATGGGRQVSHRSRFLRPAVALPWAAVLVLGFFTAYQALGPTPGPAAPDARVADSTILRVVRAEAPAVRIDGPTFLLTVDIAAPEPYARYRVEFRNEAGERVASTGETPAPATGTLQLIVRSDRFPDGRYSAVLEGIGGDGASEVVETYRFEVTRTDS